MSTVLELVAGARPNFMKLAPVVRALVDRGNIPFRIVHTGQHYDAAMTDVFFEELEIPRPDVYLEVGSGTHGVQTARLVERYEAHLMTADTAATVVFGDVNSTIACALAAVKLNVPVAHVEAGLRSFDRSMPEEINRILTDAIAELLFVSEPSGIENLRREGVDPGKVHLVGNVMIDTLRRQLPAAKARHTAARLGLDRRPYALVTLHRPSNVDDPRALERLLQVLHTLSKELPIVFPVHPRTAAAVERSELSHLLSGAPQLLRLGPLSYIDTISLAANATVVLTDSGGLQEETSVLRVPCLTLRETTERPVTVELGTSRLVGSDVERITTGFRQAAAGQWREAEEIPLWDGRAGERVASILEGWAPFA